jgi:hypothetical protein
VYAVSYMPCLAGRLSEWLHANNWFIRQADYSCAKCHITLPRRLGEVRARPGLLRALSVVVTPDVVQALCSGCVVASRAKAKTEHEEANAMAEGEGSVSNRAIISVDTRDYLF